MMNTNPKFSLVLCTLGRNNFVINFLETISIQDNKIFEIILVDQNEGKELFNIIQNYPNLNIKYCRSGKGLSVGRNIGLKYITGKYVGFPDDDCEYPESILNEVESLFLNTKTDLISMQSRWKDNQISNGNFDIKSGSINKHNVFKRVISYTIFVKSKIIKNIYFDEMLGVGAKSIFQSGEEVDFVLKILKKTTNTFYSNELFIYHPHSTENFDDLILRTKKYVPGKSYVLKKHRYPKIYIFAFIFFPFLKAFWSILKFSKNEFFLNYISFKYRLKGYLKSKFDNL